MLNNYLFAFAVTMRKPSTLAKIRLEYLLPIFELNLDAESDKCREMANELKKFYFGYSSVSPETILVYLMVNIKLSPFFISTIS